MKSIGNFNTKFSLHRLFSLSYKNVTIAEIKKRKLDSMKKTGTFAESPQQEV
jgi:hypothetical protein